MEFTPPAWAKLWFLCHRGGSEIGAFAVTPKGDPLLVERIQTVEQHATPIGVEFVDGAVADFFEDQIEAGLHPSQFARIWVHTHPGDSPEPSGLDESTFARAFGRCDWSMMMILARSGDTYARLHFCAGPGGDLEIPVDVDFSVPFAGSDHESWDAEYVRNVHATGIEPFRREGSDLRGGGADGFEPATGSDDWPPGACEIDEEWSGVDGDRYGEWLFNELRESEVQ